jgi:hypothetical protein
MFTKADSRVSPYRMIRTSTSCADPSSETRYGLNSFSEQKTGDGVRSTAGFSQASHCRSYRHLGRYHERPAGCIASTNRYRSTNANRSVGRSAEAAHWVNRTGASRSLADWISNRPCVHGAALGGSQFRVNLKKKSPDPFSASILKRSLRGRDDSRRRAERSMIEKV